LENVSPAEHFHQKCKHEQQKQKEQNELHKMVMKQVQQMITDMFTSNHISIIIQMMILIPMKLTISKQWKTSQ
jgi:hypothetical protein